MHTAAVARPVHTDAPYAALFEATRSCADCWQTLTEAARSTDSLAFRANLLALHASLAGSDAIQPVDAVSVATRALEIDRLGIELAVTLRGLIDTAIERVLDATMPLEIATDAVESVIGLGGRLAAIIEQTSRATRSVHAASEHAEPVARSAGQAMRELAALAERITVAVDALRNLSLRDKSAEQDAQAL